MINKFKNFWTALFSLTAAIGLYFALLLGKELWTYSTLYTPVPASVQEWQVRELKNGRFALAAKYSYQIQERNFSSVYLYKTPTYLNDRTALEEAQGKDMRVTAWVNPQSPQKSALQHDFPWLALVRLAIVAAVLFYFLFLRRYVMSKALIV